jgi:hypothetical protein
MYPVSVPVGRFSFHAPRRRLALLKLTSSQVPLSHGALPIMLYLKLGP